MSSQKLKAQYFPGISDARTKPIPWQLRDHVLAHFRETGTQQERLIRN
jgi:hypothetical protein